MGAVKTNHKRTATLRHIKRQVIRWDKQDQAAEAAEVRRHNRAVKARKVKRMYPNGSHVQARTLEELGISYRAYRLNSSWFDKLYAEYIGQWGGQTDDN